MDPTQPLRDSIASGIKSILPANSPLKKSLNDSEAKKIEAEKKAAEAQKLAAEAAEAEIAAARKIEGGQAAIPFAEGLSVAPVPPGQSGVAPQGELGQDIAQRAPASPLEAQPLGLSSGLAMEAAATEALGKQEAAAIAASQEQIAAEQVRADAERKAAQEKIDAAVKDIDSTKIEPKSFWGSRSTGEKITAGIGLFLAALTPEGAQNAVKIINNEIERDLGVQKANLDKKQNTLSALERKLGSVEAAESAFRVKALQNLDMQLKQKAAVAKGPLVKAKLMQAQERIQAESASARQKLELELMKINAVQGKEKKLGGEEQKRLDNAREALQSLEKMDDALRKGSNTFSIIGDNDYTLNRTLFEEALGRMQSGGAITDDEADRFKAMAPTIKDDAGIQKKKLDQLKQIMSQRIRSLGRNPSEEVSGLKGISFKAK